MTSGGLRGTGVAGGLGWAGTAGSGGCAGAIPAAGGLVDGITTTRWRRKRLFRRSNRPDAVLMM